MEFPPIDQYFLPSSVPHSVGLHEGEEPARVPARVCWFFLTGNVFLFTWGREKLREETWHRAVRIWLICLEIH